MNYLPNSEGDTECHLDILPMNRYAMICARNMWDFDAMGKTSNKSTGIDTTPSSPKTSKPHIPMSLGVSGIATLAGSSTPSESRMVYPTVFRPR